MIGALAKALAQTLEPELRRLLWLTLLVTVAAFAALWLGLGWLVANVTWFETGWLDSLVSWLGGALGLVLTLVLFPPAATLAASLFQDRAAAAVERRHYPDLAPAPALPIGPVVRAALRLLVWTLAVNLIALPVYFIPGVNLLVYFAVNGALLGREYFEVVALRRLSPADAAALRRRHRFRLWLAGAIIALGFWVPILNLAMPIAGTAFMVHVYHRLARRAEADQAGVLSG